MNSDINTLIYGHITNIEEFSPVLTMDVNSNMPTHENKLEELFGIKYDMDNPDAVDSDDDDDIFKDHG